MLNCSEKLEVTSLYIALPDMGECSRFVVSLLEKNNEFRNVGYFYSAHLLQRVKLRDDNSIPSFNSELFYNENLKCLFLCLTSDSTDIKKLLSDIDSAIVNPLNIKKIIFISGVPNLFIKDDSFNLQTSYSTYHISNNIEKFPEYKDIKLNSITDFVTYVKKESKDTLFENFKISGGGLAKELMKNLFKKSLDFLFLFTFQEIIPFDPRACFALYSKVLEALKLNKDCCVERFRGVDSKSYLDFMNNLEKNGLVISKDWEYYLNGS